MVLCVVRVLEEKRLPWLLLLLLLCTTAKRANCAFRGTDEARVLGLGSGSVMLRSTGIDGIYSSAVHVACEWVINDLENLAVEVILPRESGNLIISMCIYNFTR
jgi:hypothetical protein